MASPQDRFQWLSSTLGDAGLSSRRQAAFDWMRKEDAVISDFNRNDTLIDFSAAVGISNTAKNRLQAVIGFSNGKESLPLPEIESLLFNSPLEEVSGEGQLRLLDSPTHPGHRHISPQSEEGIPSPDSALPSRLPSGGLFPGQSSSNQRKCRLHDKWRLPRWLNKLSNGEYECISKDPCKMNASAVPAPAMPTGKGTRRGRSRSRERFSRERSNRTRRTKEDPAPKRPSLDDPPRTRAPPTQALSPDRRPRLSLRMIADSLFNYMNDSSRSTLTSKDGFFNLKDLMKNWGDTLGVSVKQVLAAVSDNLFKEVNGKMRAHFLVWQDDDFDADILLSIPEPKAQ
jgi:hypothetical protein